MEKKYELLKDDWKEVDGQRVYRIRAVKDFMFDPNDPGHDYPGVHKGMLGGYIQSESNLSHEGDCWVGSPGLPDTTVVYGGSKVEGDGMVCGDITVKNSRVTGFVEGDRSVIEDSQILDNAYVHLFNDGVISGSHISGNAEVRFGCHIDYSVISGDARIEGGHGVEVRSSNLKGNAMVVAGNGDHRLLVDNVFLEDDAIIREGATVLNSTVSHHSIIAGQADVRDCFIAGKAGVGGDAVLDNAVVVGEAIIYGDASVSHSKIDGRAQVYGTATVEQSVVAGDARISGDAVVRNYKFKEIVFTGTVDKGVHDAEMVALSMQAAQEKERREETCYISSSEKHRRETEDGGHVPLYVVYTKQKDNSLVGYKENVLVFCDTMEEAKKGARENGFTNIVVENMDRKYELAMDDASTTMFGKKHYRIRALRDIPEYGVSAGKIGGYVESENNLSHEGNCWIAHDALVSGDARVTGDALVCDRATIIDKAIIEGKAMVSGFSAVGGSAVIGDDAFVSGNAIVTDEARVSGSAHIQGDAQVYGNALVGTAMVKDNAIVRDSFVWGGAEIGGYAVVENRASLHNYEKLSGYDYVSGKQRIVSQQKVYDKKVFKAKREENRKKLFTKKDDGPSQKANTRR